MKRIYADFFPFVAYTVGIIATRITRITRIYADMLS